MVDEELIKELDGMLWRIEGNYHREGAGPGSRFEGQTLQTIQARALVRRIREWLAERGRLVPDRPGETVAECGCPITYAVAKVERHTRECGTRKAAERLARTIEEYGDA